MTWQGIIAEEQQKPYFQRLMQFVADEYSRGQCYPAFDKIFHSLELTPFNEVKVVILGYEPYTLGEQEMGLAFSVPDGVPKPAQLKTIFKELQLDFGYGLPMSGNLTPWARQGVLLINACLTVRAGESGSHNNAGWERFTASIIDRLEDCNEKIVYLLWGGRAQEVDGLITNDNHDVLAAAHPRPPTGSDFLGCKHFSKTNQILKEWDLTPINWQIQ